MALIVTAAGDHEGKCPRDGRRLGAPTPLPRSRDHDEDYDHTRGRRYEHAHGVAPRDRHLINEAQQVAPRVAKLAAAYRDLTRG